MAKGELMRQGSPVGPRTHELLYMLLWTCDTLMHPTFRNVMESFESWAYRKKLLWKLERLYVDQ